MVKNRNQKEPELSDSLDTINSNNQSLILYNDDYHTFDFVIETLMNVCDHNDIQAEQCAFIVHFKGKCDVRNGDFESLKPMKEALTDRGLKSNIE